MLSTIGDLSQTFLLRQQNRLLRSELTQLSGELSTGRVQDLSKHLSGDIGRLNSVTRQIETLRVYELSGSELQTTFEFAQTSLSQLSDTVSGVAETGLGLQGEASIDELDRFASEAGHSFTSAISALNTQISGVSIFAGTGGSIAAFEDAETILAILTSDVVASVPSSVADVQAAVDAWFETSGGGFETSAYTGITTDPSPRKVGDGESIGLGLRGDGTEIRQALKGIALGYLSGQNSLGLTQSERQELASIGTQVSRSAHDSVIDLRGDLGIREQRLETVLTRNSAESSSLEFLYNEMTSADPFETASKLEDVRFRLETHYAVTARLSRLSLTEYIR